MFANQTTRSDNTGIAPEGVGKLRITLVGAGALGNDLYRLLGLISVGGILLIDPDQVEAHNLNSSVLYTPEDIGRHKVRVLLERGLRIFPRTAVAAEAVEIADIGWGRLLETDLIFCCVDRDSARLEVARIGTRLNIPVCDGGIGGDRATTGRASFFPGRDGPCFGCRLSAATRRDLLREWQSQPYPCGGLGTEPVRPMSPVTASITAALMLDHALRGGSGSVEFRLDPPAVETIALSRSESCPFHEVSTHPLIAVEGTFAANLERGQQISWEWPICTQASCLVCGTAWNPFVRTARLRAKGECPKCGGRRINVVESINSVSHDSAWASMKPTEIGLPEDHRYTIWDKTPS